MIEETWTDSLAYSDYLGWVAYDQEGAPIFEHVPFASGSGDVGTARADSQRGYAQPLRGALVLSSRAIGRNCLDWPMLPHSKLQTVEVYFGRNHLPPDRQPAISVSRRLGADVRFFERKKTKILVNAGTGRIELADGQHRTGIESYQLGYWNLDKGVARMFEVAILPYAIDRKVFSVFRFPPVRNPLWPKPGGEDFDPQFHGYGLGAHTIRPAPPPHLLEGPPNRNDGNGDAPSENLVQPQ